MRLLLTLAVVAVLLLGIALGYYSLFGLREAHIASLVPQNFRFGVFYGSANDLAALYEGPYQRKDFNPVVARIGRRINVPELNGLDYDSPVGSFVNREDEEIFLVPYRDFGAFTEAFDRNTENINLRDPERIATNYMSLSIAKTAADRGKDNPLVVSAVQYPIALAGHPDSANAVRLMLAYLLAFDGVRPIPGVPLLSHASLRLPDPVAGIVAEECDDLLIGFLKPTERGLSGEVAVTASMRPGGMLARAGSLAQTIELSRLIGSFPRETEVLVGAVLDAAGWKRTGLPLDLGDAAFAWGVVTKEYHPRRYTLLLAAKSVNAARLPATILLDNPAIKPEFATVTDHGTAVKTARIGDPPVWLATLLRTQVRKDPPAVYLSTAVENGTWFAAIGSQAENTVRMALACLRGANELSVFAAKRGRKGTVTPSRIRNTRGHVAIAMATAEGMRAFQSPMPLVDVASIGQPAAVSFVLDVDSKARGKLRFWR